MKGRRLLTEIKGDLVMCHDGSLTANKMARERESGEWRGESAKVGRERLSSGVEGENGGRRIDFIPCPAVQPLTN